MFDRNFQQTATAALGAIILTIVSIGAAAGPARVIETNPVAVAHNAAPVAVRANV